VVADRAMDQDIAQTLNWFRSNQLPLGAV